MSRVGEHTISEESSKIAISVFVLQFLNTGVLLLLVTANFKEQGFDPYHWFDGPRTDFGMMWYLETGDTIVKTMVINNIFMPVVLEVINALVRMAKRKRDQSQGGTKCTTEQ
jgi:hypothetical protein